MVVHEHALYPFDGILKRNECFNQHTFQYSACRACWRKCMLNCWHASPGPHRMPTSQYCPWPVWGYLWNRCLHFGYMPRYLVWGVPFSGKIINLHPPPNMRLWQLSAVQPPATVAGYGSTHGAQRLRVQFQSTPRCLNLQDCQYTYHQPTSGLGAAPFQRLPNPGKPQAHRLSLASNSKQLR